MKIYGLWSLLYFVIDYISWGYGDTVGFLIDRTISFFTEGSYYHFWFFPALLFSVCFVTVLYKAKLQKWLLPVSIILYILGCLGTSYFSVGVHIPVLSSIYSGPYFDGIRRILCISLPFFAAGSLVDRIERYIIQRNISLSKLIAALAVAVFVWLLEIAMVFLLQLEKGIAITFALYTLTIAVMVFLLRYPMPRAGWISEKCHFLADFTYYSHPAMIVLVTFIAKQFGYSSISQTLMFLLVILLTGGIGMGFLYLAKRRRCGK